jgi:MFS family permease
MSVRSAVAPLRRRDFRLLLIAQTISIVGDKIDQVALSIMVYRLTGSLAQMGLMFAITFLPAALFGLVAGPFVDRWDRRRTMVIADIARAALVALIPLIARLGLPAVYAVAFAVATVSLFFEPARLSLIPALVGEDELMATNSLDSSTSAISELLGIAFGGALVFAVGYAAAFWFDALTYLVSAAFVAALAHRDAPSQAGPWRPSTIAAELADGLSRIRRDPVLSGVIVSYALAAVGGAAAITLSVLLALHTYRDAGMADALRLTFLDLATTAGLLVGSVLVGASGPGNAGRKYLGGLAAFGAVFALLFFVRDIRVAAAVMLVTGVANMWFQIPMVTILQTYTSAEARGRVLAVRMTVVRIATVIGLAGAGVAAERVGVLPLVATVGILVCLVGIGGFASPRLRLA